LSCLFVITMVFTTLLILDQAVFRLEVFSIVKTAWSRQSKVVNTIVMTNRQHNTKYLQSKDNLIRQRKVVNSIVMTNKQHNTKYLQDWRYLVLCCLFVITMEFTTLLCLDQAVFRLEVFSIVLSVCHYNGVHYFTLPWSSCL
jgi:hypothetical protein